MIKSILKKILLFALLLALILIVGGIGGVLFDRFLIPKIASMPRFAGNQILKKVNERVTVINKTEQVVIREDDSVEKIISQPATSVVNIVTVFPSPKTDSPTKETTTSVAGTEVVETTTGVLLTNDGLIVTYANVSPENPGARYSILLFDGKSYSARFIGYDTLTNLAFFHLNDTVNTPAIALANSDDARTGKRLIAIGNTFAEYQNRLSVGILGNINRTFNLAGKTVSSSEKWEGVFEMDLLGAKSFVGGPVIGFNGEMVGLVGMLTIDNKETPFLIPANVVRESSTRALSGTLANRTVLGVYYLPITKAFALGQGIKRDRGALIYSPSGLTSLAVLADTPGMRAGLQAGDIISAVNGKEVNLDNPLPELLSVFNKGDRIELLVLRKGVEQEIQVQL